jgi:lipoprotein-anchoring transpeptidase ErfK/SrfK
MAFVRDDPRIDESRSSDPRHQSFPMTKKMTGLRNLLLAAAMFVAAAPAASAYEYYGLDGNPLDMGRPVANPIPRTTVTVGNEFPTGTILVNTAERRLYLMTGNGEAIRYGIGVGRDGFRWSGIHKITAMREWPDWTPPAQMIARRPDLPRHMKGGIENPLGARAMYLGSTLYRIHGSNEPETIGTAVSSGCFRMTNDDVEDLYKRVKIGTTVIIKN